MFVRSPRLEIFIDRIAGNAAAIIALCRSRGVEVACVTKVMGAHPALVRALEDAGAAMIADSRMTNLESMAISELRVPTMLLRPPTPSRVVDVVRLADISLNSSFETVCLLSRAAEVTSRTHRVVLMVDVGDLREGLWPDRVVEVATACARLPGIELVGLGTNLACFGGVVPTRENMQLLVDLRDECRAATGLPLDLLSGGNSANLPLLASGGMPPEINQLRIGEAITLGLNVLDRRPWPGTRQDTLRLVGEVIEVGSKPSVPIGMRTQDAFGEEHEFVDRGTRRRAILNMGRQDLIATGLTPEDPGILVVGASSDHLVLDVEDAEDEVRLGDEIAFCPSYGSLLAATTSPSIHKVVRWG